MNATITSGEISQFNVLTNTWLSETEFISDETRFLKDLVFHHTTFLSNESYLDGLQQLSKNLNNLEKDTESVSENIQQQLHRLHEVSAGKPMSVSVKDNHGILEKKIAFLTKEFRSIRNKVLELAAELDEKKPDVE